MFSRTALWGRGSVVDYSVCTDVSALHFELRSSYVTRYSCAFYPLQHEHQATVQLQLASTADMDADKKKQLPYIGAACVIVAAAVFVGSRLFSGSARSTSSSESKPNSAAPEPQSVLASASQRAQAGFVREGLKSSAEPLAPAPVTAPKPMSDQPPADSVSEPVPKPDSLVVAKKPVAKGPAVRKSLFPSASVSIAVDDLIELFRTLDDGSLGRVSVQSLAGALLESEWFSASTDAQAQSVRDTVAALAADGADFITISEWSGFLFKNAVKKNNRMSFSSGLLNGHHENVD